MAKNNNPSKFDFTDALSFLAIIAIIVSLVFIGLRVTGYTMATNATVNITINQFSAINFSVHNVDFGTGAVDSGYPGANMSTDGINSGGSWTPPASGLQLQNIGNTNVSIRLRADANASTFIGGLDPEFKIKLTNTTGKFNSCPNVVTGFNGYREINTTDQMVCTLFRHGTNNSIDININLFIPSSAPNGDKGTMITASATAVA
jgi:hypothetical protein